MFDENQSSAHPHARRDIRLQEESGGTTGELTQVLPPYAKWASSGFAENRKEKSRRTFHPTANLKSENILINSEHSQHVFSILPSAL
ncbi:MAG: hypothetical protein ACLSWS_09605 [Faecalispora jeddahensis]